MASGNQPSSLLIEEYLASGDARFLESLRQLAEPKKVAGIAEKWKKDHRPWARGQILQYLQMPFDRAGHETLIKRLFKQAEGQRDDELMAAFLVAFDRLVRRQVRTRHRYDWQTRQSWQEQILYSPRNSIPRGGTRTYQNPKTLEPVEVTLRGRPGWRLFSYRTRHYLRRRAWRYFRRMGFQRPKDYVAAVARALRLYRDEDLARGENLLDSWGLIHICFGRSEVLEFNAAHARLRDGRRLGELAAAPYFAELWRQKDAAKVLLSLLSEATARAVRVWAMQLLRADHRQNLSDISAAELLKLLDHDDAEIQQFGAELLETVEGVEKWPLATWLRLLQTKNLTALETIARIMARHVSAERLDLGQCVELASAEPVPVARLGLAFLKSKPITSAEDRQTVAHLAGAKCAGIGGELARWALEILGTTEHYDVETVCRFFDSLLEPMRQAAWDWLTESSPGYNDPALWSRLLETPHDDVRMRLVKELEKRAKLPGTGSTALASLWSAVLLGVHRGGRTKLTALRQISQALVRELSHAEQLLPVVAVAIRSVRSTEARSGLAAVVVAVEARPELATAVGHYLPELELGDPTAEEVTA